MAQTGKEKQAQYRAKMRKAGYKQVQLWVKDKDSEELKRYIEDLEKGVKRPKTSLRWDCERVVLEMHVKSREVAVRSRKVGMLMERLLKEAALGYKNGEIPKYVYFDIVELLRPLLGEDLYKDYKTRFETQRISSKERALRAGLFMMFGVENDDDLQKWVNDSLEEAYQSMMNEPIKPKAKPETEPNPNVGPNILLDDDDIDAIMRDDF